MNLSLFKKISVIFILIAFAMPASSVYTALIQKKLGLSIVGAHCTTSPSLVSFYFLSKTKKQALALDGLIIKPAEIYFDTVLELPLGTFIHLQRTIFIFIPSAVLTTPTIIKKIKVLYNLCDTPQDFAHATFPQRIPLEVISIIKDYFLDSTKPKIHYFTVKNPTNEIEYPLLDIQHFCKSSPNELESALLDEAIPCEPPSRGADDICGMDMLFFPVLL